MVKADNGRLSALLDELNRLTVPEVSDSQSSYDFDELKQPTVSEPVEPKVSTHHIPGIHQFL